MTSTTATVRSMHPLDLSGRAPPPQKRAGKMAKSSITQLCFIPDCAVFQNSDSGKAKQLNKKNLQISLEKEKDRTEIAIG